MAAVGGPRGTAVGDARGAGQVAPVAVLGRDGEDLAPALEERAHAGGGQRRVLERAADIFPVRAQPGEIAAHGDVDAVGGAAARIVEVDVAALLVDDRAAARASAARVQALDVEVGVAGDLADRARAGVVGPDVRGPVPVGEEVDLVAEPDGIEVVAVVPRNLLERPVVRVDDPHRVDLTAAVASPLGVVEAALLVGEARAVGGEVAGHAPRNRHLLWQPAAGVDREEPGVRDRRARASGIEDDTAAVVRPADDLVRSRVPGEAFGVPSFGGQDVDIGIAVVLGAEGDVPAVRGEVRVGLLALEGGEAPGLASGTVNDPQVVGIRERDVRRADRRLAHEAGGLLGGGGGRGEGEGGRGEGGAHGRPGGGARGRSGNGWDSHCWASLGGGCLQWLRALRRVAGCSR